MQYIQDAMAQNRDKISQLKEKLRTSTIGGDKLKKDGGRLVRPA